MSARGPEEWGEEYDHLQRRDLLSREEREGEDPLAAFKGIFVWTVASAIAAILILVAVALHVTARPAHAALEPPTSPAISLFATICIDGTLHGQPLPLCALHHEFQIRRYDTIEGCERERKIAVDEWIRSVAFLAPHLVAERCGPAEPDPDGDDI